MAKPNRKDVTSCAIEMLHARIMDLEARERSRITAVEKCFADLDHNQSDRIAAVCVGLAESERLLSEKIDAIQKELQDLHATARSHAELIDRRV